MKTFSGFWRKTLLALIIVIGFTGYQTCEASGPSPDIQDRGYARNDLLVSVDWLKNNLENNQLLLIDTRSKDAYENGHIPGAIHLDWKVFSDMKAPRGKGFAVLLSVEQLTEKFQAYGLEPGRTIVVYADPSGWGEDGRVVWMLRMAGLTDSKILDGGWPAWKNGEGTVTREETLPSSGTYEIDNYDTDMLATTEWMRAEFENIKILDVRTKKEFDGATDYKEPRGGHITGAIHIPWTDFLNIDSTVKSQTEIEEILARSGIEKDEFIVTYCTSGIRSAHTALVLRMAGFEKAKNYDASINEWGAFEDLPMEK